MDNTSLRQSIANAKATGTVSEMTLQRAKDKNGEDIIRGTVVVKINDTNSITYRVYVAKNTKAGKENPAWKGLETVMNTYKSIAEVGEENATKVHINGQYAPSTYMSQQGQLREGVPQYRTSFFTEIKDTSHFEPKAEIEVEVYITNVASEIKNDEETGRKIVRGWINLYAGLEPITLIAPAEIGDAIETDYTPGTTAIFFADVVNSETVREIPVRLGRPRKEVVRTNELVINGVEDPEDEDKAFDPEAIKRAVNAYNERIESLKNGTKAVKKAAPSQNLNVSW